MSKVNLIDLHSHSLLSDGVLLPSELVRRYVVNGFKAIAITDHVDSSNIDFIIKGLVTVSTQLNKYWNIKVIPGVELTHIPLEQFKSLTKYARKKGAKIVVAHGESPVEPVLKGTNRAAIEAGVDIVAHPGKILKADVQLAAKKKVALEVTTRRGHLLGNSHVAKIAKSESAKLVIDSDSHTPENIPNLKQFEDVAKKALLTKKDIENCFKNSWDIFHRVF